MPSLSKKVHLILRRSLSPLALGALKQRCRIGPDIDVAGGLRCNAVVASYLRPQNLQVIVNTLVKCRFVERIVITNHNPDISIEEYLNVDDSRLQILNSDERKYAGHRFTIASQLPGRYFIVLDDDVFMFPEQIRKLFRHLTDNPRVAHGFHGTRYFLIDEHKPNFRHQHVSGHEAEVDVLHQGYAVTDTHIKRMLQMSDAIRADRQIVSENPNNFADDILISLAGESMAQVHNLAPILTCPTSLEPNISVSSQHGFDAKRDKLFAFLSNSLDKIDNRESAQTTS